MIIKPSKIPCSSLKFKWNQVYRRCLSFSGLAIAPFLFSSLAVADTVYQNADWTITIGNEESWTGVNGTGNLTYRGCDRQNRCLSLQGGTVTCRQGTCTMVWRNGDYAYLLRFLIREDETQDSQATLIVKQGEKILLETTNFQVVR